MESIRQVLQSYLHFRTAVLRALGAAQLSKDEFARITGLAGDSKYRRQQQPDLWKPVELTKLAWALGLGEGITSRLAGLAPLLVQLPIQAQKRMLKASMLTDEKLRHRLEDADSWQAQELAKLSRWCDQRPTAKARSGVNLGRC